MYIACDMVHVLLVKRCCKNVDKAQYKSFAWAGHYIYFRRNIVWHIPYNSSKQFFYTVISGNRFTKEESGFYHHNI